MSSLPAKVMTLDFSRADDIRLHKSGRIRDRGDMRDQRPMSADGKLLTPKQIRARARRRSEKARRSGKMKNLMTEQEFEALYKPMEEWDMDELARGRPRDKNGGFAGAKPKWITRQIHEEAMERFTTVIKTEMGVQSITALDTLKMILTDEQTDERGKPVVPASAKMQAATFLLEHVVGKPKQHVQQDISVKLQGVLASVMANPTETFAPQSQGGRGNNDGDAPSYQVAHYPGHTIPIGAAQDNDPNAPIDVEAWEDD